MVCGAVSLTQSHSRSGFILSSSDPTQIRLTLCVCVCVLLILFLFSFKREKEHEVEGNLGGVGKEENFDQNILYEILNKKEEEEEEEESNCA